MILSLNKGYLTAKTDIESDEYFTPENVVKAIIPFIPKEVKTIWRPFDKENSSYVRILGRSGYNIIYSHIDNGKNFFEYEPENYDCIISNPPFSLKDDIVQRLYELNKPYAILLPLPSLQGQKRFKYIKDCQALIFNKRINFYKDDLLTKPTKGVAFATIYLCRNFLPNDLMFMEL